MQEFVKCPICGKEVRILNLTHLATHGYSDKKVFIDQYPDCQLVSERHSYEQSKRSSQMYIDHPELHEVSRQLMIKVNKSEEQRAKCSMKMIEYNQKHGFVPNERYNDLKDAISIEDEELRKSTINKILEKFPSNINYSNARPKLIRNYQTPDKIVTLRSMNEKMFLDILNELNIYYKYEALRIPYLGEDNKIHDYIPDVYIPSANMVIEIKFSEYDRKTNIFKLKKNATESSGYKFVSVIHGMTNEFIELISNLPAALVE